MNGVIKKCLQQDIMFRLITGLAALYIRFIFRTTRWNTLGEKGIEPLLMQEKGFIVSFWHQRLFMAVYGWVYDKNFFMLISGHKDGQLISKTVSHFGIKTISGSTSKGGTSALKKAILRLKEGQVIGITPDGPRGPQLKVQPGVVAMAKLAEAFVVPFTYAMTYEITLKTWDSFRLPLPFGKGVIAWGEPVKLGNRAMKDDQETLERAMLCLQKEAEAFLFKDKVKSDLAV